MQQAVEEVLAGFAARGKTAGGVGAGREAALDGFADADVFVLDFFAASDARLVGDIGEVEVENDFRFTKASRDHEVRVHGARISIDHEVGIDPVVQGLAAP